MENSPSRIYAICEEETTLLALPVEQVNKWVNKYSSFINLLYNQFNLRYLDLIDTIDQLIFKSLDVRLYNHLKDLSRLKNKKLIKVRHQQLAKELGSAREMISRMLKKLEREAKISRHKGGIEVF
ncbi:MAG: Crp/Fnr family transcriptional regulator [Bacteroidetes bacterium]|nr:Crp/Fnr family transcriptional regulator [Bacteroidota bacterium]